MLHRKPLRGFYVSQQASKRILCFIEGLSRDCIRILYLIEALSWDALFHIRHLWVFNVLQKTAKVMLCFINDLKGALCLIYGLQGDSLFHI